MSGVHSHMHLSPLWESVMVPQFFPAWKGWQVLVYGGAIWLKDLVFKEILSGVPKGLHHSDHDNNTWNERRITKAIQRDRVWVLPGSSC